MSPRALVALSCLAAVALAAQCEAQLAAGLDQYQLDGTVNGLNHSTNPFGQWFTVGRTGTLSWVELSLDSTPGNTEDLLVEVRDVSGGLPGTTLGSVVLAAGDVGPFRDFLLLDEVTATLVDLRPIGLDVSVGNTLAIWLETGMTSPNGWLVRYASNDPYAAGQMTTASGVNADLDLTFKIFVAEPLFDDNFESGDTGAWSNGVAAMVTATPYRSWDDILMVTRPYCDTPPCPWVPPDQLHDGIDFAPVDNLEPFRSACTGTVVDVDLYYNPGNGYYQMNLRIDWDADPTYGVGYAFEPMTADPTQVALQQSSIVVSVGDPVAAGDTIGYLVLDNPASHVHWGVFDVFSQTCHEPYLSASVRSDLLGLIHRDNPQWSICN
jgi:hypothetical protein